VNFVFVRNAWFSNLEAFPLKKLVLIFTAVSISVCSEGAARLKYRAGGARGDHPLPVINERPSRNDGEKWKEPVKWTSGHQFAKNVN
jgi:hypothetical protein